MRRILQFGFPILCMVAGIAMMAHDSANALSKPMGTMVSGTKSVGTTAAQISGTPGGGSCSIMIYNSSATIVHIGGSNVAATNSIPICTDGSVCPSSVISLDASAGPVYGVVASGTVTVRFLAGGSC